jgi:glycosyltransferase involved in cell wall biosynthesis
VTAVIPVRDGAAFLADALHCAQAQADDVIVVDDGSTDGSAEIARAHGVRVVRGGAPGAGPSRNAGVAAATGDLIAFLDADDRWPEGSLRKRMAALDEGIDLVYGRVREFLDRDAPPHAVPRPPALAPIPSAILVRRASFERTGGFPADVPGAEAVAWYARALAAGLRVRTVDSVACERRLHAGNVGRAGTREALLRAVRAAVLGKR